MVIPRWARRTSILVRGWCDELIVLPFCCGKARDEPSSLEPSSGRHYTRQTLRAPSETVEEFDSILSAAAIRDPPVKCRPPCVRCVRSDKYAQGRPHLLRRFCPALRRLFNPTSPQFGRDSRVSVLSKTFAARPSITGWPNMRSTIWPSWNPRSAAPLALSPTHRCYSPPASRLPSFRSRFTRIGFRNEPGVCQ